MNFLAHLALAGPTEASRIGNILGDFEKGTPESIRERLPDAIVDGIVMHRQIDRFTDDHPVFHESKLLLAPERRRFAGILIDIFYDHFLHKNWSTFHPKTVPEFITEIYETFEQHPEWLGQKFGPLVPQIRSQNWLDSYRTISGLEITLGRVSQRSPRLAPLSVGLTDLTQHYDDFEKHFLTFYPEARKHAAKLLGHESLFTPAFP